MNQNIVILHGWASKRARWEQFKNKLGKQGFQVFLPSLPGFGQNKLVSSLSLGDYVKWFQKYLQQKDLSSFCLVGHSFGGSIAIKYASLRPKNLSKLVLVDSAGIRERFTLKKILFYILAKIGKLFFLIPPFCFLKRQAQILLYTFIREKDYFKADKVMKETLKKILKQDLRADLFKIKTPALIVWGRDDKDTPLKHGYLLNQNIAGSRLVVYDGVGHGVPFKRTDQLIQEITDFCQSKT